MARVICAALVMQVLALYGAGAIWLWDKLTTRGQVSYWMREAQANQLEWRAWEARCKSLASRVNKHHPEVGGVRC